MAIRKAGPAFWDRLQHEIEGDAASDLFTRGRYATDASMHQCFPRGVVFPKNADDVAIAVEMAREEGLPIVARGGGSSTAGQALGEGVVIDFSKYMTAIIGIDVENLRCTVEAGCSPLTLQAALDEHGLFFPVEIGSAAQATLGGMLGNNSSGLRAMRHGAMRDVTMSADTLLADGHRVLFKPVSDSDAEAFPGRERLLDLLQFGEIHEGTIARFWPPHTPAEPQPAAYDLGALLASSGDQNPARLLAGAEGTLALAAKIELKLAKKPENRALGVCRFASLVRALKLVPKIATLNPAAIEFLDKSMLGYLAVGARAGQQAGRLLRGDPGAVLVVEFDENNPVDNTRLLKALADIVAEGDKGRFSVIEVLGENAQASLWALRKTAQRAAWLPQAQSFPLSILEDGAVPLSRLAAYGGELEEVLARHAIRTALYGQAGRGALHIRPSFDLSSAEDRRRMRVFADEMAALIGAHRGALTSGRGLGLTRSEIFERALPPEAAALLKDLKTQLDPGFLLNPGKILRAPRLDDAALLRATRATDARPASQTALDWEPPSSTALDHASRCSGLGHCRSAEHNFRCPSHAVTLNERDSPRGRANVMRLALSGQLGEGALIAEPMLDAMRLCASCKACTAACPNGVDIPKLKVEMLAAARAAGQASRALDLFARLPEYTGRAARWRLFLALRDLLPPLARLGERRLGLAADRPWPRWSGRRLKLPATVEPGPAGLVALFADTFNRSFEPANLRAAAAVLRAAGYGVVAFTGDERPLCCGRTYYDAGYIEEARREASRMASACAAFAEKGIPVVGLEPSCMLMMRDEYASLGVAMRLKPPPVMLFEEFLAARLAAPGAALPLKPIEADLLFHPHCHERALGVEGAAQTVLQAIPKLAFSAAPPSCCGLNGVMGMTPDTLEASLAMAELSLFPAIRKAGGDALIAATAYSCRKQIQDGLGRTARHPAALLELALKGDAEILV